MMDATTNRIEVLGNDRLKILASVVHSAGTDELLPALTYVKLATDGYTVNSYATDRYTMAVASLPIATTEPAVVYIPAVALAKFVTARRALMIARNDVDEHGRITWALSDGSETVSGQLLSFDYPNVDGLWHREHVAADTPWSIDIRYLSRLERMSKTACINGKSRNTMQSGKNFKWTFCVPEKGVAIAICGPLTVMFLPQRQDQELTSAAYGYIDWKN